MLQTQTYLVRRACLVEEVEVGRPGGMVMELSEVGKRLKDGEKFEMGAQWWCLRTPRG